MGLPCRHIAAALYTAAMHGERHPLFLEEKNIRPRWRYQAHPICTLFVSTCEPNVRNPNTLGSNSSLEFNCNLLSKIKAPSKVATRFSKLQEICGPLLEEGKTNVYNYKVVMAYLSKAVNGITSFYNRMEQVIVWTLLKTHRWSEILPTRTTASLELWTMLTVETWCVYQQKFGNENEPLPVTLAFTIRMPMLHVTSHRAYSQQCPQRSNPNHIKNPAQAAETRKKFDVVSQSALTIAWTTIFSWICIL